MAEKLRAAALAFLVALTTQSRAQEGLSPWGQPPGYYPGQALGVPAERRAAWQDWMRAHAEEHSALGAEINAIKAGAPSPGCFGRPLFDCIASLAQTLVLTDVYATSQVFYPPKVDVNGKPIRPRWVKLTVYKPGPKSDVEFQDQVSLEISLSDRYLVEQLLFEFNASALTQEEYDRTGVYELFSVLAKDRCPALTRNELARFIENKLKPARQSAKASHQTGVYDATVSMSPFTSFCGRRLQLGGFLGHAYQFKDKQKNPTGEFQATAMVIR